MAGIGHHTFPIHKTFNSLSVNPTTANELFKCVCPVYCVGA